MLVLLSPASTARGDDIADRAELFAPSIVSPATTRTRRKAASISTRSPGNRPTADIYDQWVEVFDKVDRQKMPPPSRKQPDPAARAEFLKEMRTELRAANLARQQTEGRVVLRRLNRVEYENTLHDLLAIDMPLQHFLPEDATTNGFDNVAAGLRLSMLADGAVPRSRRCRDIGGHGRSVGGRMHTHKRLRYHDEESVRDDLKKRKRKPFVSCPTRSSSSTTIRPPCSASGSCESAGRYRIRISARAYQAAGRPVWLKLYATDFKTQRLLAYFDLPADAAADDGGGRHVSRQASLLNLSPFDTNYDDQGRRSGFWGIGAEKYPGRGIAIEWVEVDGPLFDRWPPPSVGRLFGDLPVKPVEPARGAASGRRPSQYTVAVDDPRSSAAQVLRQFASRAFRRPVTSADVERFVKLAHAGLDDGLTFEDAMSRRLPRRDHVAEVPVSRRATRASRRLGAGVPAVLFSLEYAARRRFARARGQRDLAPTLRPA